MLLVITIFFAGCSRNNASSISVGEGTVVGGTFTNVIVSEDTPDPTVVYKDGWYYMTFTHHAVSAVNIPMLRSRTLDFSNAQKKVVYTPPTGSDHSLHVWAPSLQYIDGRWLIYFAASPAGVGGNFSQQRMHVIAADTQDPWSSWSYKGTITDSTDKWAIDGTVLDIGSNKYFVWSGWEGDTNFRQLIYIAPMSDPFTISGPRVAISYPEYSWEMNHFPYINEGPQPIIRDEKVFIIYSASGSWTPDYSLGQLSIAITSDPLIPSNWTKKSSPVFERNDANGVFGPGHNSFTTSPDGTQDWIVYHATTRADDGWNNRRARAQMFTWNNDGTPNFGVPHSVSTPLDVPSGTGKFEAEHQVINRATILNDISTSKGKKVGLLDFSDSWIEWRYVRLPADGIYRLQIRYANASGYDATHNLIVNDIAIGAIKLTNTGENNWRTVSKDISLNAGSNSIKLTKGDISAEIDYIAISRFEAEHALLSKTRIVRASPLDDVSNDKKVRYPDSSDGWIEFRNIHVSSAGTYTMRVRFANVSGENATNNISVNGVAAGVITYPYTGEDNLESLTKTVNLRTGSNYIRFANGNEYVELDYIEIYPYSDN